MANYQFLDAQGNLVGPVSLETLQRMKQEGKLGGQTQVLDEAAKRFVTLDQLVGGGGGVVFPAPPLKAKRFFYADLSNTPVGPFTLEELQQQMVAGKVRAETQVIEEGGTVWQQYSSVMMERLSASTGGASVPPPPPSSNPKEVSLGYAILWFLCCVPIGFCRAGGEGVGLGRSRLSPVGWGVAIVDCWMCFSAQQKRRLGEWGSFLESKMRGPGFGACGNRRRTFAQRICRCRCPPMRLGRTDVDYSRLAQHGGPLREAFHGIRFSSFGKVSGGFSTYHKGPWRLAATVGEEQCSASQQGR